MPGFIHSHTPSSLRGGKEGEVLLQVNNLEISFIQEGSVTTAVKNISFTVQRGKLTAIVGESGSGKSVTALSLLKLLPKQAEIKGEILFYADGKRFLDLTQISDVAIQKIRGKEIAMIFQEPMTSLNPVFTCGYQVMESLLQHKKITKKEARQKTIELFEQVELPDAAAGSP